jgi:hypothetical protein
MFVAVLSAAALGPRAYCLEPAEDARPWHPYGKSVAAGSAVPMVIAADNTPNPVAADALGNGLPATSATVEIPPADKDPEAAETAPAQDQDQNSPDAVSAPDSQDQQQTDEGTQADLPPHVYSLQDFVNQGMDDSPLGIELREDCTKLQTHEKICGLAVLDVRNGSPAEKAGVKRFTALTHDLLDGASVAAALVFPPAIVAVAVIDQSGIGETFDLVIGVDGRRVRHILDFQDLTSSVRPGDTVYLTIVRAGKRVQLPVQIPAGATAFRN